MTDDSNTEPCRRCGRKDDSHERVASDCVLSHRKPHVRADTGYLCQACVDRHRDWLTDITELYATLGDVELAGSIVEEVGEHMRPPKAPASPSPLRLGAWAIRHGRINDRIRVHDSAGRTIGWRHADPESGDLPRIATLLVGWAQHVYDTLWTNATAPQDVSGAAAALHAHADTIAGLDTITAYDTDLRWIRRTLRTAHGIHDPQPFGTCLGTDNGAPCDGQVMPDRYGGQPWCNTCERRYGKTDLIRLQITEEQTG